MEVLRHTTQAVSYVRKSWRPPVIEALILALWAFSIPLPAQLGLDRQVRLLISNSRPYVLVMALLVALGFHLLGTGRRNPFSKLYKSKMGAVLMLGMLFPCYYLFLSVVKQGSSLQLSVFYFSWAVFSFLYAPFLVSSRQGTERVAKWMLVAAVANILVAAAVSIPKGLAFGQFSDRLSLGYSNPTYFSQVVQLSLLAALTLVLAKARDGQDQGREWLLVVLTTTATGLLAFLAKSESTLLFILATFLSYRILRFGFRGLFVGSAVATWLLVSALLLGVFSMERAERIDEFSSYRMSYWETLLSRLTSDENGVVTILFGDVETPQDLLNRYDDLRSEKSFGMPHRDSVYFTFLVDFGLIGLVLFLAPYAVLARQAVVSLGESKGIRIFLALFIGVAVQGAAVSTIPSFNNPVGFWFGLFSVLPIAMIHNWQAPGRPDPQ